MVMALQVHVCTCESISACVFDGQVSLALGTNGYLFTSGAATPLKNGVANFDLVVNEWLKH